MFLRSIATILLCSIASTSFSEIIISEKVRHTPKPLVNPDIQRLEIPPTPNNMSLPSFGKGIIGWGSGPKDAEDRLNNVTQSDVEKFKDQGVTLEMIQTWQKFYENETRRNTGNPTAPFRAKLMEKIASLW